nr:unnamed protein product [Callosobruchus chinensis]
MGRVGGYSRCSGSCCHNCARRPAGPAAHAQHRVVLRVAHQRLMVTDLAAVLPLPAGAAEVPEAVHVAAEVRTLLDAAYRAQGVLQYAAVINIRYITWIIVSLLVTIMARMKKQRQLQIVEQSVICTYIIVHEFTIRRQKSRRKAFLKEDCRFMKLHTHKQRIDGIGQLCLTGDFQEQNSRVLHCHTIYQESENSPRESSNGKKYLTLYGVQIFSVVQSPTYTRNLGAQRNIFENKTSDWSQKLKIKITSYYKLTLLGVSSNNFTSFSERQGDANSSFAMSIYGSKVSRKDGDSQPMKNTKRKYKKKEEVLEVVACAFVGIDKCIARTQISREERINETFIDSCVISRDQTLCICILAYFASAYRQRCCGAVPVPGMPHICRLHPRRLLSLPPPPPPPARRFCRPEGMTLSSAEAR